MKESQLASSVLMIRPVRFESNPQTAASNSFQSRPDASADAQQAAALEEFDALADTLRAHGVHVIVFDDRAEPHTPDALFPNNWVSFHADGRVVLYPMEAENRRLERRPDIIDALVEQHGFLVTEIVDLSAHERAGHYLEGTGSLVLDRVNHVAYACRSSRTHLDPLGDFAQRMSYEVVSFDAVDRQDVPIYHTNVMMNVGEQLAVVCMDSIAREDQREAVLQRLRDSGRQVMSLDYDQLEAFAGNMLELRNRQGERLIAMSQQAFDSLRPAQVTVLRANGGIVTAPIGAIETCGGGSVRCMLAEVHLPAQNDQP